MKKLTLICTALVVLAACQKQETKTASAPAVTAKPAAVAPATSPDKVTGVVAETLDSGGFTYARLTTDGGEKWVVVRQTALAKGATITVVTNMVAEKFESKSLKKSFDKLIFGELEGSAPLAAAPGATGMISAHAAAPTASQPPVPPMAAMMKAQHSGVAAGPADDAPISVAKAEGENARTVAEIWASRATAHDGQPVVIRGKVVKFLSGIMGKNWVHVRDGSGSHDKGDNDITVTTNDTAAVGSVVVVTGVLHVNKDFGAGYSYPVIIEEAKVK